MRPGRFLLALALAAGAALCLGAAAPPPVDDSRLLDPTPAPSLADYRLFLDAGGRRPNRGVMPYALNTPLFSDYAVKRRYLYLPPGSTVDYRAEGPLAFPVGAALVKTFAFPADFRKPGEAVRVIETRLLIRKAEGWSAVTYVWNADQTRATPRRAGLRLPVSFVDARGRTRAFDYAVPNVNQCKQCHAQADELGPIGPRARNLNGVFDYPGGAENQLGHWTRIGRLRGAPPPEAAPRTPRWDDTAQPLASRARAYLDANCGHCHSRAGLASNSGLYLTLEETDPDVLGVGKRPVAAGKGSGDLEVAIDPGHPARSILLYRMASTEPGVMMPQLGRSLGHDEGVALIRDWIAAMPAKTGATTP